MEKEEVKEKELTFGEIFDFNNLFRAKGKKGLYFLRSQVNKAGLVAIEGFLDSGNKQTVKAINLVCLGHLHFETLEQVFDEKDNPAGFRKLSMAEVMTNFNDYVGGTTQEEYEKESDEDLMYALVPNFNPDEFKDYHAKQVLLWYKEITSKIKKVG